MVRWLAIGWLAFALAAVAAVFTGGRDAAVGAVRRVLALGETALVAVRRRRGVDQAAETAVDRQRTGTRLAVVVVGVGELAGRVAATHGLYVRSGQDGSVQAHVGHRGRPAAEAVVGHRLLATLVHDQQRTVRQ